MYSVFIFESLERICTLIHFHVLELMFGRQPPMEQKSKRGRRLHDLLSVLTVAVIWQRLAMQHHRRPDVSEALQLENICQ